MQHHAAQPRAGRRGRGEQEEHGSAPGLHQGQAGPYPSRVPAPYDLPLPPGAEAAERVAGQDTEGATYEWKLEGKTRMLLFLFTIIICWKDNKDYIVCFDSNYRNGMGKQYAYPLYHSIMIPY